MSQTAVESGAKATTQVMDRRTAAETFQANPSTAAQMVSVTDRLVVATAAMEVVTAAAEETEARPDPAVPARPKGKPPGLASGHAYHAFVGPSASLFVPPHLKRRAENSEAP